MSNFDAVPQVLAEALTARGFTELTPVQAAVLNATPDRDLLVSARTGSGKTVAFGLRMGPLVLEGGQGRPRALVVCPTRELALQVAAELSWLFARMHVVTCVGGMDPRRESMALQQGADIVVGTPGRLCDHLNRRKLHLDQLRAVVLDEADEMLDMGFRDELELILQACPSERQTLLFSATFPPVAVALAEQYTRTPERLALSDTKEPHADISWVAMLHAPRERELVVVNVLRHYDAKAALVFCHTREGVHRMHAALVERGFSAAVLSGDLGQAERSRALAAVRDGRARVLVATNVAARGIDLPSLDLVIHADLPNDVESFTHRSGRTGRAGRKGVAVVLVAGNRRRAAERLFHLARVQPERVMPPRAESIRAADEGRLSLAVLAGLSESAEEDARVAERLLKEHDATALVASLVAGYRRDLPVPEELPESFGLVGRPSDPERMGARVLRAQARDERRGYERPRGHVEQPYQDRSDGDSRGGWSQADIRRPDAGPRDVRREQDSGRQGDPRREASRSDARFDGGSDGGSDARRDDGSQREVRRDPRDRHDDPRGSQAPPRSAKPLKVVDWQRSSKSAVPDRSEPTRVEPDRGGSSPPRRWPAGAAGRGPDADRPPARRDGDKDATREGRRPGSGASHGVTFRVNRGYKHHAEPRWLVPLFCRRGRVESTMIGRIDVREQETWFEIHPDAAEQFDRASRRPDRDEPGVRFERVE